MKRAHMANPLRRFPLLALGLTVAGALTRLIPHPPNFAPVGGVSLFAGARLRGWQAYLVPLLLMAVTDPVLSALYGFSAYSAITPFVYGSFLINVWIGSRLRTSERPLRIGAAVAVCSLQFFLVTNFAVWLMGSLYPHSIAGLGACYAMALPFLGRTLAGDLFYSAALFGLYAWLSGRAYQPERTTLESAGGL